MTMIVPSLVSGEAKGSLSADIYIKTERKLKNRIQTEADGIATLCSPHPIAQGLLCLFMRPTRICCGLLCSMHWAKCLG